MSIRPNKRPSKLFNRNISEVFQNYVSRQTCLAFETRINKIESMLTAIEWGRTSNVIEMNLMYKWSSKTYNGLSET